MAVVDPTAIYMAAPEYGLDNIVAIYTGSLNIAAPSNTPGNIFKLATATHDTGFGENCYFQGVFNVNGGATYNDLGVYTPILTTPIPTLQTQTVRAFVSSTGILNVIGVNWYNFVAGTGAAATVGYKILIMTKNTQGNILPTGTNEDLYFNSAYNYQKIFMEGSVASPTTGNVTVAHNLGYVPKVRAWYSPSANITAGDIGYTLPAGCMATLDWLNLYNNAIPQMYGQETVDSTNLVFSPMNGVSAGTLDYRIYLDA
jgi:hypothetical protein